MGSILIYDGRCGVCSALVRWTKRRDRSGKMEFIPYQTADFVELPVDVTKDLAKRTVILIDNEGKIFREARAVFEILKLLPGFYGFIGTIFSNKFFGFLSAPFYRLVARNRGAVSKIFGAREPDIRNKIN